MAFQIVSTLFKQLVEIVTGTCWDCDTASYDSKSFLFGIGEQTNEDLEFKSDGTEVYVLGSDTGIVYQFTLSTPWDTTTANYTTQFSVISEESDPKGLDFSSDGTKMFIVGYTAQTVYQYTLSTPWDISTAVLVTGSPSTLAVSAQDTQPAGLSFGDSGTKVYVTGKTNSYVYQYDLSIAWDITTATYIGYYSPGVSVNDVDFNTDGTKMYLDNSNTVLQYTLLTAWNVTTAIPEFVDAWLSIDNMASTVGGIYIKSDGLKLYAADQWGFPQIREFTFREAWNIETVKPLTKDLKYESEAAQPADVYFKSDGTKMFVFLTSNDAVESYTLSTAWDVTTAMFDSIFYEVEPQDNWTTGGTFTPDGTKLFICGRERSAIHAYTMSIPWDLTTATYDRVSRCTGLEKNPTAMAISSDGTSIYFSGFDRDRIHQLYLDTPYDLSTIRAGGVEDSFAPVSAGAYNLAFSTDGTKMYAQSTNTLYQYTLNVPWRLATAIYEGVSVSTSAAGSSPRGLVFNDDGTRFFLLDGGSDDVFQFNLSTPWDISSSVYASLSLDCSPQDSGMSGLGISADGTKLYLCGQTTDYIYQYTLPTPYDLTGASYASKALYVLPLDGTNYEVVFNNTGTTAYMLGGATRKIYEIPMSVAWDISTGNIAGSPLVSFSVYQDSWPHSLAFNDDGSKIYVLGELENKVFEYNLSTPYDISTMVYSDVFVNTSPSGSPYGLTFGSSGTKMYISDGFGDSVYQFTLSVPWDLSTAAYDSIVFTTTEYVSMSGIAFNNTGTRLIGVSEGVDERAHQFDLSTPWDLSTASVGITGFVATSPDHIRFKPDGSRAFVQNNTLLYQYSAPAGVGSPVVFDITGFTYDSVFYNMSTEDTAPKDFVVDPTGTKLYMLGNTSEDVYQYELSSPWDLSTISFPGQIYERQWGTWEITPRDIAWAPDGLSLFLVGSASDEFNHFTVSVPWDLSSTVTWVGVKDITTPSQNPLGLFFKSDGTKVYNTDSTFDGVYQWSLPTPYVLSGITYDGVSFFVGTGTQHNQTLPAGLTFSSDGTKMFITGATSDKIAQYPLGTAWDLSTAGFGSPAADYEFSLNPPESSPYAHYWSSDGTKLFVVGTAADRVYKYEALTPWEVSTLQPYDASLYIGGSLYTAYGLTFSDDGTKMYVTNTGGVSTSDTTHTWNLSIPWDITSAIASKTNIGIESYGDPVCLELSTDGTKMFFMDDQTNAILFSYTLSTPWDIETAVVDNIPETYMGFSQPTDELPVNTYTTIYTPKGMRFSKDGTRLTVCTGLYAMQYTLGTPWDITTLDPVGVVFNSFSETNYTLFDIEWNPSGNQAFAVLGFTTSPNVIELSNVTTPYDLTGVASGRAIRHLANQGVYPRNIHFSPDGTQFYIVYDDNDAGQQRTGQLWHYELSTPWDITSFKTGSPVGGARSFFNIGRQDYLTSGFTMSTDGTKMYIVGYGTRQVFQYTLSTPWDLFTATFDNVMLYVGGQESTPKGVHFDPTGTTMYINGGYVHSFTLSVAWDISTAVLNVGTLSIYLADGALSSDPQDIAFSSDGTKLFVVGNNWDQVNEYVLTTPWDITTGSSTGAFISTFPPDTTPRCCAISSDGTKLYLTGDILQEVVEYDLSVPNSLATAKHSGTTFITTLQDSTPEAVAFNSTGTKMYMAGRDNGAIYQYTLSTPYNVSTATYDNVLMSVIAQDYLVQDLSFNDSGTMMFIIGTSSDALSSYTLSTPWDISTASYLAEFPTWPFSTGEGIKYGDSGSKVYIVSPGNNRIFQFTLLVPYNVRSAGYDGKVINVTSQGTNPVDMAMDTTGTKMYVIDSNRDEITQYTLSTPWDITTATYDGVGLIIGNSVLTAPQGISFSSDGTNMYVADSAGDRLTHYALTTAWDVSTAYPSDYITVPTVDSNPRDVAISSDGTKAFMLGDTNNKIFEYNLSTPYDMSTATQGSPVGEFAISGESTPTGMFFKPDGTRAYVVGSGTDTVYQYDLGIAWDISSAAVGSPAVSLLVSSEDSAPSGVTLSADGSKMYVSGDTNAAIFQYTLPTPWDLTGAFYSTTMYAIGSNHLNSTDVVFSPDGLTMYTTDDITNLVYQVPLSTPWDITTFGATTTLSVSGPSGMRFNNDGTIMYVVNSSDNVMPYSLGTPYDITTAGIGSPASDFYLGGQDLITNGIDFSTDGTKMYMAGDANNKIYQYDLGVAWQVNTAVHVPANDLVTGYAAYTPTGGCFKPDGTKMYVVDDNGNYVYQYTLGTAFDVTTATPEGSFYVGSQDSTPNDMAVSSDGLKMYILGWNSEYIYEYDLGTPWQVSTAVYNSIRMSISTPDNYPEGMTFSPDGYYLFYSGTTSDRIYRYSLGTAWDLSTATIDTGNNFYVGGDDSFPAGIVFSSDGMNLYMVGHGAGGNIYQYSLGTAWDLTTAGTYIATFPIVIYASYASEGLAFNDTGTKIYLFESSSSHGVWEFDLSTPWDLSTATYNNGYIDLVGPETSPTGTFFKPDGTRLYVAGADSDSIFSYTLGTPWDLSTASIDIGSLNLTTAESSVSGLWFAPDGLTLFITGKNSEAVLAYGLSVAWDITSALYSGRYSNILQDQTPTDVTFSSDGTKMFVTGDDTNSVLQYTLSTPWDVSSGSYDGVSFVTTLQDSSPLGISLSTDGTQLYICGQVSSSVHQFNMSTPLDLTTATFVDSFDVSVQDQAPSGMAFKSDGTKMVVSGAGSDSAYQYGLSTPWDITTAALESTVDIAAAVGLTDTDSVSVSADGTKMIISNASTGEDIWQFTLSTPWDVSTATYDNISTNTQYLNTVSFHLSNDGTKLIVFSSKSKIVYQYTLSIAWDVTTATYASYLYVGGISPDPQGCRMCTNGAKLFIIGGGSPQSIHQYTLSSPWNLATAVLDGTSFDISSEDVAPAGFTFNDDGTVLYVVGDDNNQVFQYLT